MKVAYLGSLKSGKSRLAEQRILANTQKPYYLATTQCLDEEMQLRIAEHQKRRGNQFEVIEEPLDLFNAVKRCERPVLIECVTAWLNNMLYHQNTNILATLEQTLKLPNDVVWVHNEVGLGIIPDNRLARQFADLSGRAGQLLGQYCDEVYFCIAGIATQIK